MNGIINLTHGVLDRQSHKDQGIVEIRNKIRFSARLVMMQNYLLKLIIKLCLDHKGLVCYFPCLAIQAENKHNHKPLP